MQIFFEKVFPPRKKNPGYAHVSDRIGILRGQQLSQEQLSTPQIDPVLGHQQGGARGYASSAHLDDFDTTVSSETAARNAADGP